MTDVPPTTGLAGLSPGDALDGARLLGVTLALAAEVFMLKAELERLKRALGEHTSVDASALERIGEGAAMRDWIGREQAAFAAALLRPFTDPDAAADVTRFMSER